MPRRTAFILSSGRTGTQFLARYLDANFSEVCARHEPWPGWLLRIAGHAHLAGRLSRKTLVSLLKRVRRRYVDPLQADLYVESNPYLAGFVDVLDAVWEDPVVLHIVRDPREQVRSSLNHGTARGVKGALNRWLPHWSPDVRGILPLDGTPTWLERTAGLWRIVNEALEHGGERCAHYHRFRYEDLFAPDHSGLRALCGALRLSAPGPDAPFDLDQRVNAARGSEVPGWERWPAADCRALERICGALMQRYGYGSEPAWRARTTDDG